LSKSIYEYSDYKVYLNDKIKASPAKGRGLKLKIAEFLNCQNTFISQVLNGLPHFSLEQGIKLNSFVEHTKEEGKFFIQMIHFARAGNSELKEFYQNEMNEIILRNTDLKKRTNVKNSLRNKDQDIYYSSWHYSAVHILVTIKEYQTAQAISKRLHLSKDKTMEILNFLTESGLLTQDKNIYTSGNTRIHLSKDSPHIQRHHTNWRLRATQSIDLNTDTDLHFSSVVSMSKNDIIKVREIFIKAIAEARSIVKDSSEEKLQSICVDFFEV
jgi:uncharacterized protein (TIGR02147 family)